MNNCDQLLTELKKHFNNDFNSFYYRISSGNDLDRVIKFGSSRIGISKKIWDRLEDYNEKNLPKYPIYHEEVIIASSWEDLVSDAKLKNGTLKHKLDIYKQPFFTIYKKNFLYMLGSENKNGENNQGTHFLFLDNPINCLDSIWNIKVNNNLYYIEEVKWK